MTAAIAIHPRLELPPLPQGRWNQPARLLGEAWLRVSLARDLSQGDLDKAAALLSLPLFDVAMDGNDALEGVR